MSEYLPHTIVVDGIYALPGYPVTRLDVGLPTYRRFAAGGISSFIMPHLCIFRSQEFLV